MFVALSMQNAKDTNGQEMQCSFINLLKCCLNKEFDSIFDIHIANEYIPVHKSTRNRRISTILFSILLFALIVSLTLMFKEKQNLLTS